MDSLSPATQRSPVILKPFRRAEDGDDVRWPTRVSLARDDSFLRVRFECRDENRWATHSRRNAPLWQEEVVEVFIAPGADTPRRYFEFEINPLGALFDAAVHNPDSDRSTLSVDTSWNCPGIKWRVGHGEVGSTSSQDWWAELDLPWRSLVEGARTESEVIPRIWRVNFFRVERPGGPDIGPVDARSPEPQRDAHRDEYSCWSPTLRNPADFHVPERFGYLILNPSDLNQHHDSDVQPNDLPVMHLP